MKRTLKELATSVQAGYQARGAVEEDPAGTHWLVQMRDLRNDGAIDSATLTRFTPDRDVEPYVVREGDVLLQVRGVSHRAGVGDKLPENTLASSHFYIFRIDPELALPAYLAWYINQPPVQQQLQRAAQGTGNVTVLKRPTFESLEIPLLPLEKQRRIVALDRLRWTELELLERVSNLRTCLLSEVSLRAARAEGKDDELNDADGLQPNRSAGAPLDETYQFDVQSSHFLSKEIFDPSEYSTHVSVKIRKEDGTVIGRMKAYRVELSLLVNHGHPCSVFEVTDSIDQEFYEYCTAMLDDDGQFREELELENPCADLLVLHTLELLPPYRRHGLGGAILMRAIECLGHGCSAVVMKPSPINHSKGHIEKDEFYMSMRYSEFKVDEKAGQMKLQEHWRKLGCAPVPGFGEFYYFDLALRYPSPQELLSGVNQKEG